MSGKSPSPDDSMRGMKLMVFAMGMVLIGGVLVLVYAGFRKIEREGGHSASSQKRGEAVCQQNTAQVTLPKSTLVSPLHISEGHITATVQMHEGDYRVLTYNRCTGALEHSFTLRTAPQ